MLCFYLISILQILCEPLPISSSGHSTLVARLCTNQSLPSIHWMWLLHVPTLCIIFLYFARHAKISLHQILRHRTIVLLYVLAIIAADAITTGMYLLLKLYPLSLPLSICFLFSALALISLRFVTFQAHEYLLEKIIALGFVQGIALIPGISRFALVFTAARWFGFSNALAFALTWLIQIPLMAGGGLMSFLWYNRHPELLPQNILLFMVLGAATILSYGIFLCVAQCAYRGYLWLFGIYMIIPTILAFVLEILPVDF